MSNKKVVTDAAYTILVVYCHKQRNYRNILSVQLHWNNEIQNLSSRLQDTCTMRIIEVFDTAIFTVTEVNSVARMMVSFLNCKRLLETSSVGNCLINCLPQLVFSPIAFGFLNLSIQFR